MKIKYILMVSAMMLAACSHDSIPGQEDDAQKPEINLNEKFLAIAPTFKIHNAGGPQNPDSRADLELDKEKNQYAFRWEEGDMLGVFPCSNDYNKIDGDQIYFKLHPTKENEGMTAVFDGGGWSVKPGYTYEAYYPFNINGGFYQNRTNMEVDFTKQTYSNTGNYLHDFLYMSSKAAMKDGKLHFQFKPMVSVGNVNIVLQSEKNADEIKDIKINHMGIEGVYTYSFLCKNGSFNLDDENPAISSYRNGRIDLYAGDEGNVSPNNDGKFNWKFVQPTVQTGGKTALFNIQYTTPQGDTINNCQLFTFNTNMEVGNVYDINLNFPKIDKKEHSVYSKNPGQMNSYQFGEAMDESSKLVLRGNLNNDDFKQLQNSLNIIELDLGNASYNPVLTKEDFNNINSLNVLTLPKTTEGLSDNVFEWIELTKLTWEKASDEPLTNVENSLNNFNSYNCDLIINRNLLSYVDGYNGKLRFLGREFKSIKEIVRTTQTDGTEKVEIKDIETLKIDPNTNTITALQRGFITQQAIDEARNGGDKLIVKGRINQDDVYEIGAPVGIWENVCRVHVLDMSEAEIDNNKIERHAFYKAEFTSIKLPKNITCIESEAFASCPNLKSLTIPSKVNHIGNGVIAYTPITSLIFECEEQFNLHGVFADYPDSYSSKCDLVIPVSWKDMVEIQQDGSTMFQGLKWKSVKDKNGNDIASTHGGSLDDVNDGGSMY